MVHPKRIAGTATENLGDGIAIYHPERERSYVLNATSALVWKHCDGQTSRRKLTRLIMRKFNVPPDQAKELMLAALCELDRAQLLETKTEQAAEYSRRETIKRIAAAGFSLALIPVISQGTARGAVGTTTSGPEPTSGPPTTTTTTSTTRTTTSGLLFEFTGFFRPVDNPPSYNQVRAGQGIPVKFSLGGDQGLDIFAAGYPKSRNADCGTWADAGPLEETMTAGKSSLSYDAVADQYVYPWKTEKAWKNTCRRLVVKLSDGQEHVALFTFK